MGLSALAPSRADPKAGDMSPSRVTSAKHANGTDDAYAEQGLNWVASP